MRLAIILSMAPASEGKVRLGEIPLAFSISPRALDSPTEELSVNFI